jgi:hypothetical protein
MRVQTESKLQLLFHSDSSDGSVIRLMADIPWLRTLLFAAMLAGVFSAALILLTATGISH